MHHLSDVISCYFIALGVVLGGSLIGMLATIFTGGLPLFTAQDLASRLKIWGMVTALGGTFDTFSAIEYGLFGREYGPLIRQGMLLLSAFGGAHSGYILVRSLT